MSREYYDTSAFAKLFIQEAGSETVLQRYRTAAGVIVSRLALVEVRSAVQKALLLGFLNSQVASTLHALIDETIPELSVISLDDATFGRAEQFVLTHSLRALDALQLACAVGVEDSGNMVFVSCDRKLIKAAEAQGLSVFDPTA